MAAAGTLLADLDTQSGGGDGDLVQKILSDMNVPTGEQQQRRSPPPLPAQTPIYQQQMASSTQQMTMDSRIPTSHMIGNEHPTPADLRRQWPQCKVCRTWEGGICHRIIWFLVCLKWEDI